MHSTSLRPAAEHDVICKREGNMEAKDATQLVAAVRAQSQALERIAADLHRIMLLISIQLTPEQRTEMAKTDAIIKARDKG
jgi:hypothetical protein